MRTSIASLICFVDVAPYINKIFRGGVVMAAATGDVIDVDDDIDMEHQEEQGTLICSFLLSWDV